MSHLHVNDETWRVISVTVSRLFVCVCVCCRVVLRKQVHKKTVIRDGQEETLVTEDTHIEQDNDGPEELRESVREVIDKFMEVSGDNGSAKAQ